MTIRTDDATRVPFRGGQVAVYEVGEGPTIGYLHGMLGNPGVHPGLAALAERHRVIAPSLPGFLPSAPDENIRFLYDWVVALSEVVDATGLAGQPVVASSVTAMLALELATVRPDAFGTLVLLSPLGLWDDAHPVADVFGRPSFQQRALLLEDPGRAKHFFEDDPSAEADVVLEHGVARHYTRRATASLMWPLPDHGLASRVHRVATPVGLVWGANDQVNPPAMAEHYAAALRGHVGTRMVPDAGHCVEWDAPEATATAVEELLSGAPSAPSDEAPPAPTRQPT